MRIASRRTGVCATASTAMLPTLVAPPRCASRAVRTLATIRPPSATPSSKPLPRRAGHVRRSPHRRTISRRSASEEAGVANQTGAGIGVGGRRDVPSGVIASRGHGDACRVWLGKGSGHPWSLCRESPQGEGLDRRANLHLHPCQPSVRPDSLRPMLGVSLAACATRWRSRSARGCATGAAAATPKTRSAHQQNSAPGKHRPSLIRRAPAGRLPGLDDRRIRGRAWSLIIPRSFNFRRLDPHQAEETTIGRGSQPSLARPGGGPVGGQARGRLKMRQDSLVVQAAWRRFQPLTPLFATRSPARRLFWHKTMNSARRSREAPAQPAAKSCPTRFRTAASDLHRDPRHPHTILRRGAATAPRDCPPSPAAKRSALKLADPDRQRLRHGRTDHRP